MVRTIATAIIPEIKEYGWKVIVTPDVLEAIGAERLEALYRAEAWSKGTPIPSRTAKIIEDEGGIESWTWKWFGIEFYDDAVDTDRVEIVE